MDDVIKIVKQCSHPDMVISARPEGRGVVITVRENDQEDSVIISLTEINQLDSKQLERFVKDSVKSVVAAISQGLIRFTDRE